MVDADGNDPAVDFGFGFGLDLELASFPKFLLAMSKKAKARLQSLTNNETSFPLAFDAPNVVGREFASIIIPPSSVHPLIVSRKHAVINYDSNLGKWFIEDGPSANGVFVDGLRLGQTPMPLVSGTELIFGHPQVV